MKRFIGVIAAILFLPSLAWSACVADGANWTSTPDYASVNECVTNADAGDTITVSAGDGTETWASQLTITKGLKIIGPGSASLTITADVACTAGDRTTARLINYVPDATERAADNNFRISGFTFDGGGKCGGIHVENVADPIVPTTKVRIDNNAFTNNNTASGFKTITFYGAVYGVIDNNTFNSSRGGVNPYGIGQAEWDDLDFAYGDANKTYIEDNTFNAPDTDYTVSISSSFGGRWVARYNTFNQADDSGAWQPTESHGNQIGQYSFRGAELYGNLFSYPANGSVTFAYWRGGKSLTFFNKSTSTGITKMILREEYGDDLARTENACTDSAIDACGHDGQTQHISDTYAWANFKNTTLVTPAIFDGVGANCCSTTSAWAGTTSYTYQYCNAFGGSRCYGQKPVSGGASCTSGSAEPTWGATATGDRIADGTCSWLDYGPYDGPVLAENAEFWNQPASFDGTVGVGCGTLASRPATCTTGVAYWATDQSCTDMTGLVGVGATALAGTLYKCTSTDTWSAYYTPYSYPHPLRGETTTRTITSSKVGAVGTLSYEGESIVNDGDNSQIYTAANIPNGWKVTWSGTGGCTGNGTTCQVLNVTGDATVIATFTEIKLMPW